MDKGRWRKVFSYVAFKSGSLVVYDKSGNMLDVELNLKSVINALKANNLV